MDGREASRIALRAARQEVLRAIGIEQRRILEWLGMSKRQASYDAARVRAVRENRGLLAAARRPLPPVAIREDDWIRPERARETAR